MAQGTMGHRISVVIPARDRQATIGAAIRSVQAQTLPAHEILVVDDASRDRTAEVVETMARSDPRIRCRRLEAPSGAPTARNAGAAEAIGSFLAFLDSDDLWHPDKLRLQMRVLEAEPRTEAVGCHFVKMGAGGVPVLVMAPRPRVGLADLVAYNLVGPTSILCVRREAFEAVGGFDPLMPSCQDWELLSRLAARADIRNVQAVLVEQGVSADNRITRDARRVVDGHRAIHARTRALARERGLARRWVHARQAPAEVEVLLRHGMLWPAARLTARAPYPRSLAKWVRALAPRGARMRRADGLGEAAREDSTQRSPVG